MIIFDYRLVLSALVGLAVNALFTLDRLNFEVPRIGLRGITTCTESFTIVRRLVVDWVNKGCVIGPIRSRDAETGLRTANGVISRVCDDVITSGARAQLSRCNDDVTVR